MIHSSHFGETQQSWHFSNLPNGNFNPNFILPSKNSITSCGQSRKWWSLYSPHFFFFFFPHLSADLRQIPLNSGALRKLCLGQHSHFPCINCRKYNGCFSQRHESAPRMPTQQSPDVQTFLCYPLPKSAPQKGGEIIIFKIYYYIILWEISKGNCFLLFIC